MFNSRFDTSSILLFSLLAMTACGDTNQSFKTGNLASEAASNLSIEASDSSPKVVLDLNVLREQGTPALTSELSSLAIASGQKSRSSEGEVLQKGTQLVGVIDTQCADSHPQGISSEIMQAANSKRVLKVQAYSFVLEEDTPLESLIADAEDDSCLKQIVNDGEVLMSAIPNDPQFSQQWHHTNLQSASAWDTFYGAGGITSNVVLAVLDTGVDYTHPDLASNIVRTSNGVGGYDFISDDSDPMDENGHGTHCAGLAAAVMNNSTGIAGVMGTRMKILPVKVLASGGTGSVVTVINGINFAIEKNVDIITLSLAANAENVAVKTAIQNAVSNGITVFTAAGNSGLQLSPQTIVSPASYGPEIQGLITVGATMPSNNRAAFSNYGDRYVEIGAPGYNILSTGIGGTYFSLSGTSMATPISAGAGGLIIGLLRARGITPTPALVEQLLITGSAHDAQLAQFFRLGTRLDLASLATHLNTQYPPVVTPPVTPPPVVTPPATPQPRNLKAAVDRKDFRGRVNAGTILINNVLANDIVDSVQATPKNVILTKVNPSPWLRLNTANGRVIAKRALLPGRYVLTYKICKRYRPATCRTSMAVVRVFR